MMIVGHGIKVYRLLALRSALKLELAGIRRRGPSALSIIKREFGVFGSREKILRWLNEHIETEKSKLQPGDITD
jgi:hypothetical protein